MRGRRCETCRQALAGRDVCDCKRVRRRSLTRPRGGACKVEATVRAGRIAELTRRAAERLPLFD